MLRVFQVMSLLYKMAHTVIQAASFRAAFVLPRRDGFKQKYKAKMHASFAGRAF